MPERPRLDPRCTHVCAGRHAGRCQLWAGHFGPHAVMFVLDGRRLVRAWSDERRSEWHDVGAGYEGLCWMRGFPMPAWQERS